MDSLQRQSAQYRKRTGLIMIMAYVHNPRPCPQLDGFDDPVLHQASRDAVLWLGINLLRGLSDERAHDTACAAALRSARDVLLRRWT